MPLEAVTLPPPYQGLDLVTAIDSMNPSSALEMVNMFPGPTAPISRNGYSQLTNLTASSTGVKTLFPYNKTDGTSEIIAVCDGSTKKIYKIVSGAATDITGSTAITAPNMQAEQFSTILYLCNGTEAVQAYNGTTVADSTFTFPGGSGVTLANLINVSSYKERVYFVQQNSLKFWYGNTQATGSSQLTAFNLEYVMRRGGRLIFAGSYTNSTGQTSTDLFWAISSEGEIVFYAGSSPADTNWSLVARYVIGKPLGYRSFIRINNDVWIITEQGIIPISALFQTDPTKVTEVISGAINPYITKYAKLLPFSARWHGMFWPLGRRVFINVPSSESNSTMLVHSLDTNGWCVYELADKEDNNTINVVDGVPYYGSNRGYVYKAEDGFTDRGFPVSFSCRTAFSYMGNRATYKAFKDIRPLIETTKGITLSLGLDTDFQRKLTVDTVSTGVATYTPWGSPWGSPWSSGTEYLLNRYAVRGQGHSAAVRFGGSLSTSQCRIFGFEIRFDQGGQV